MSTDSRSVVATERRQRAFELRKAGWTYDEIGACIGVTKQAAHGLVSRELRRLGKLAQSDAKQMLTLELERLETLHKALWDGALEGDLGAIDRLLKISARRSRLMALDELGKVEVTAPQSAVIILPDNGRDGYVPN